jgi:hypothetical protein
MTGEILRQYTEAGINERLHLFLQFPDLRRSFQEIDRKDLAFQKVSTSLREEHDNAKYSLHFLLLRRAYHRIIEIGMLKNLLKSLNAFLLVSPLSCCGSQFRPDGYEATRQDQAATDKMLRSERLSEQNHSQYRSVNGEHIIEYHRPVRPDPAHPFVP